MKRSQPTPRGARLRGGDRLARDRDRGFAAARSVLRLVDDRLGEPDRDRPGRARARLLPRRQAGRPAAGAAAARPDRARRGACCGATPFVARPFLDATASSLDDASAGAVIGSFFAVLLLFAPRRPAARDGVAIRDPARDRRTSPPPAPSPDASTPSRRPAPSSARSCRRSCDPARSGRSGRCSSRPSCSRARRSLLLGRRWLVLAAVAFAVLLAMPPGAVKAERGPPARGRVALPVHPGARARRRPAPLPERGRGRALASGASDTVLTGGVWDAFLAVPLLLDGAAAARRDPRQRGRHARARVRRLLAARADRRRRDRPGRHGRRLPLLRPRRQPAADDPRRGRAAVPAAHRPALRPDLRRRLPPAVRPLLPRDAGVLPARPQPARPGGLVALNVATVPGDRRLVEELAGTLANVVPRGPDLARAALQPHRDRLSTRARRRRGARRPARARPARRAARARAPDPVAVRSADPWTDDHAPVEWVTDRMIVEYAAARRRPRRGAAADGAGVIEALRRDGGRGGSATAAPPRSRPRTRCAALERGVARGRDPIEFDVLDLADGTLVLAHSDDLARGQPRRRPRQGARALARRAARARAGAADARRGARLPRRRGTSTGCTST